MRLIRLELEKFGAFEGLRLDFRPEARLHVVYGPNGAGKSTALAAVGALFFGVPRTTRYDFRFAGPELRIGGEIEARDGRRLTFRRRKGAKNTLLAAGAATLPDDALAPFLGGVGEEVFHRSFGLDSAALRAGGEAMLKADGDLGASMLAAASGLRGLGELRRALESEADAVFAPRAARDRRFYQALDRYETARKAIREKELRVDDWRKLNADIEASERALAAAREARRAAGEEQSRLRRLKRVAPILGDLAARDAALAAFADLAPLVEGQAERLRAALAAAEAATAAAKRAREEEARLARDLAAFRVDPALLDEAAPIEALVQNLGAIEKARRDLPRVQAEADGFADDLAGHARALGLADAAALEAMRPSAAALADLRRLIALGRKREAERSAAAERARAARETLAAIERAGGTSAPAIDPAPLREKFAALGRVGEEARALGSQQVEAATAERELSQAAMRLDPPAADLDALATRPPPDAASLAKFGRTFADCEEAARDAARRRIEAETAIEATRRALAEAAAGRPLATAEAIAEARGARDEVWRDLRARLLAEPAAPPLDETPGRIVAFERFSGAADRLADEAGGDAQRLARHAEATRRLDGETRSFALALAALDAAAVRREALTGEWSALWRGLCAAPRAPEAMRAWLGRIEDLLAQRARLAARRADLARREAELTRLAPLLSALTEEAGLPALDGLDPARLAERIARRLDELAAAHSSARERDARRAETRRAADDERAREAEADALVAEWRRKWGPAVAAVGLDQAASIEAAEAALAVWAKAPDAAENRRDRRRRVEGMRRDVDAFERQAAALASRLASDLAGLPAEAAARRLSERLAAERQAETRRAAATERLAEAARARAAADVAATAATDALAAASAALPAGADLAALLERHGERARLAAALIERRRHLIEVGDGRDEAELRHELSAYDPDAAEARLVVLADAAGAAQQDENERYAERARLLREREALEGGIGAEAAWQQRRNAEADLAASARRWTVLKTASLFLGAALERHRAERRDPMMTRAGETFAQLTGGAFSGLEQAFGDDDLPRLEARRAGGERVGVEGLSEGERDQLYLALRLASIEDYAARAEAPPFIGDDIFPSFDDPRTAHGVEALAAIADRVQPILFTHHAHVVEAAVARLGEAADVIRIG